MKTIKSINLENFSNFTKVSVSFDKNVTYLVGKNGSGKSTIGLTGLWFVLQGIAEKAASKDMQPIIAERFRFIGPEGPSAKGSIVIHDDTLNADIIVRRKLTKDGTTLSFEGPETLTLDQKWLNSIFDAFMLSPSHFERLSPVEQAIALGIDVTSFDQKIKDLKSDYTVINRQITALGTPVQVMKVEKVDTAAILAERQLALTFNQQQDEKEKALEKLRSDVISIRKQEEHILTQIKTLQDEWDVLNKKEKELIADGIKLPQPEARKDLSVFDNQLTDLSSLNDKAVLYEEYIRKDGEIKTLKAELEANKKDQETVANSRTVAIKNYSLPFEELTIDEVGSLMLSGRPIKEPFYSKGERIKIILALAVSRKPDLRYAYLQDFNLLDEDNQATIIQFAKDNNIQLVIELVDKNIEGLSNAILLQDNEVMEENVTV